MMDFCVLVYMLAGMEATEPPQPPEDDECERRWD